VRTACAHRLHALGWWFSFGWLLLVQIGRCLGVIVPTPFHASVVRPWSVLRGCSSRVLGGFVRCSWRDLSLVILSRVSGLSAAPAPLPLARGAFPPAPRGRGAVIDLTHGSTDWSRSTLSSSAADSSSWTRSCSGRSTSAASIRHAAAATGAGAKLGEGEIIADAATAALARHACIQHAFISSASSRSSSSTCSSSGRPQRRLQHRGGRHHHQPDWGGRLRVAIKLIGFSYSPSSFSSPSISSSSSHSRSTAHLHPQEHLQHLQQRHLQQGHLYSNGIACAGTGIEGAAAA